MRGPDSHEPAMQCGHGSNSPPTGYTLEARGTLLAVVPSSMLTVALTAPVSGYTTQVDTPPARSGNGAPKKKPQGPLKPALTHDPKVQAPLGHSEGTVQSAPALPPPTQEEPGHSGSLVQSSP